MKVLCVGAGYFATFHLESWQRMRGVELAAVADPDMARARAVGVPAFPNLTAALQAVQPDIIDLIVPPSAHDTLVREALAARPRAVICQKPFATSLGQAQSLAQAADAVGIPLIIHENFRFQPWYRLAAKIITSGQLGMIHQISFRLRTGDGQGADAYLDRQPYFQTMPRLLIHETAVHWVDTFRFLLGPITSVYSDLRRMNPAILGEDAGHVIFDFASGARAMFDGDRHLDHAAENTRLTFGEALIEGTLGTLTLGGDGALTQRGFGEVEGRVVLPPQAWPGFAGDCVHSLQSHVAAALSGEGQFENEARDYVNVRQVEEAIYRSNDEKRKVSIV